jgi:hypothetical protein
MYMDFCLKVRAAPRILAFAFTLMLLAAPACAQQAEWNFLVYMAAANNLAPFAAANLQQMAKIGSGPGINVVVQVARAKPPYKRFRVEKGDPDGGEAVNIPSFNSGDPKSLVEFVEWANKTYPAKRTAVIVWNHGSGWRDAELGALNPNNASPTQVFKAIAFDDKTGDKIYQVQLEGAFKELKEKGVSVDLIGFDACLMSMMEVWYGLASYATVGVGSEDLEPGYGWSYDRLLSKLTAKPGMDPEELGRVIVDTYADSITNSEVAAVRSDSFTLAAIRLSAIPSLAGSLDALSRAILENSNATALRAARSKVVAFSFDPSESWPNGVDLHFLLDSLAEEEIPAPVKDAAIQTIKVQDGAIIHNRFAESLAAARPHGIAIYFPETLQIWTTDPEGKAYSPENKEFPVSFVRDHRWPLVLKTFLEAERK